MRRQQRVGAVAQQAEHDEGQPEEKNLGKQRSALRVKEWRHEGEEEQRGLGVEHVDHDTLAERPPG